MYNDIKWPSKQKQIRRMSYSRSGSGAGIIGPARSAFAGIYPPLTPKGSRSAVRSIAVTLSAAEKRTPALNLLIAILSAPVATPGSTRILKNMKLGKSPGKGRMSLISLGWRVTPTRKKIGH